MGEVAAVGEIHAQDRVARFQQGQKHSEVGLSAAVGLHVGPGGTKELLGALNRQLLDGIDVLTAAVIAAVRQAFGVLVGENGALGGHHRWRGEVFTGNQLQVALLPFQFFVDQSGNLWIALQKCLGGSHGRLSHWRCRKRDVGGP